MKNNNIPADLIKDIKVKERHSNGTWLKALIYLAIAIGATSSFFLIDDNTSSAYMMSAIIAVVCYLLFICTLIFSHKNLIYNGETIKGYTLFFNTATANLQKAIEAKDEKSFISYKNKEDKGLKLELAYTHDGSIARYRLYRYIPFEFQPDSEIINIDKEQLEFIQKA